MNIVDTFKTILNHFTGQAHNKDFLGAIAGALAPALVGGLLGGGDEAAPQVVNQNTDTTMSRDTSFTNAQQSGQEQSGMSQSGTNAFGVNTGLFQGGFDPSTGQFTTGMNGQMAGIQNQNLDAAQQFGQLSMTNPNSAMAGQLGNQFMSGLATNDPMQLQNAMYQQQQAMVAPQQQQQQLDMEQRQFAQGRLGSTSGANDMGQLLQAQNMQNNGLLNNAFQQAQAQQMQQAGLGSQFSQLAPQLQGMFGGLQSQNLQNVLGMQAGGLDASRMGGLFAGQNMTNNQNMTGFQDATGTESMTGMEQQRGVQVNDQGGFSPMQSLGQGLIGGAVNETGKFLNGMFQPAQSAPSGLNGSGGTFSLMPQNPNGYVGGF